MALHDAVLYLNCPLCWKRESSMLVNDQDAVRAEPMKENGRCLNNIKDV